MIYGSVCSGIEAASEAWHPLGWKPSFFSEIEKFPRGVLQHHYSSTPLHGDFTTIQKDDYESIELLVGGTPCQSFSVAGLRGGLDDDRGNLSLQFLKLADRLGPTWLVWENVPGVLSSNGGRDFGSILGGMVELGYGCAYRVLDAQYYGVPQRRRRVFLVGYFGNWRCAYSVLFERESLLRNPPPSRKKRHGTTRKIEEEFNGDNKKTNLVFKYQQFGRYEEESELSSTVQARDYKDATDLVTVYENHPNDSRVKEMKDNISSTITAAYGTGGGNVPLVNSVFPISTQNAVGRENARDDWPLGIFEDGDPSPTLTKSHSHAIGTSSSVRRLTPIECERLQGFPDNYTQIPWRGKNKEHCPDGPRYKAIGNSMAVPVMRWLGERIQKLNDLEKSRA
jgi:DNA (cytosine-5)-methyltransferase 1